MLRYRDESISKPEISAAHIFRMVAVIADSGNGFTPVRSRSLPNAQRSIFERYADMLMAKILPSAVTWDRCRLIYIPGNISGPMLENYVQNK